MTIKEYILKKCAFLKKQEIPGCSVQVEGRNNVYDKEKLKGIRLKIKGSGNTVQINGNNSNLNGLIDICGNNNFVCLNNTPAIRINVFIGANYENNNCRLLIDEGTTIGDAKIILRENDTAVRIGKNCRISNDIDIDTSDTHSIFDEDGKLLNPGGDVIIGNHVWIGKHCRIGKKAVIADDCVVGQGSVVTKPFEETGCIIAGVPAKIVKRHIVWNCKRPDLFK